METNPPPNDLRAIKHFTRFWKDTEEGKEGPEQKCATILDSWENGHPTNFTTDLWLCGELLPSRRPVWNTACFSMATVNCGDIGHVTLRKTFKNLFRGSATSSRLWGYRRNSTLNPGSEFILCIRLCGLSLLIGWGACQDPRGGFAVMNLNRGRVRLVWRDVTASNLIRSKQEVTNKRNCQPRWYRGREEAEATEILKKWKKKRLSPPPFCFVQPVWAQRLEDFKEVRNLL